MSRGNNVKSFGTPSGMKRASLFVENISPFLSYILHNLHRQLAVRVDRRDMCWFVQATARCRSDGSRVCREAVCIFHRRCIQLDKLDIWNLWKKEKKINKFSNFNRPQCVAAATSSTIHFIIHVVSPTRKSIAV